MAGQPQELVSSGLKVAKVTRPDFQDQVLRGDMAPSFPPEFSYNAHPQTQSHVTRRPHLHFHVENHCPSWQLISTPAMGASTSSDGSVHHPSLSLFIYLPVSLCSCSQLQHMRSLVAAWQLSVGDLVPRPGIEPGLPALGAQNLSHWTIRKVSDHHLWMAPAETTRNRDKHFLPSPIQPG